MTASSAAVSGREADTLGVRDPRVDVRAKFALARMSRGSPDRRADAIRLIRAINGGWLAGIYGDDLQVAAQTAARLGTVRWKLVPPHNDATLVSDSPDRRRPPTVIFRGDTPDISKTPLRLDAALSSVSRLFATRLARGTGDQDRDSLDLIRHPLLVYLWARRRAAALTPVGSGFVPTAGGELDPDLCINFDDNRTVVAASLTAPFRFVCSIAAEYSSSGGATVTATGTGTLVSPKHVLTSGHVAAMLNLEGNAGWRVGSDAARVLVVPGRNHAARAKVNRRPRGILEVERLRISGTLEEARRRGRLVSDAELIQFDYALLTLKAPVAVRSYGFWGRSGTEIREVGAAEIVNRSFVLAGYPGDKCGLQPSRGSASTAMLRACFKKTSPPGCGADVVCHLLSDVASTSWQTPGVVLSSPPSNIKAPLAFSLEASVCAGMSGSPIWLQEKSRHLLIGIWAAFLPNLPVACGTRIHSPMISELRTWMREDGLTPPF